MAATLRETTVGTVSATSIPSVEYLLGGCTRYGTYVGDGSLYGKSSAYSVYRKDLANGYELNFVSDVGCKLHQRQQFLQRVQPSETVVAAHAVTSGLGPTDLYVLGGLSLGAAAYFLFHHKKG